jgi:uncharacterized protein (TIGR02284 family)
MELRSESTANTLNELIECCKDGELGFRASAEQLKSEGLKEHFMRWAAECESAAAELQTLVVQCGGRPENSGTAAGALHRGWVAAKGALAGYTDLAVLEETEREEDEAMGTYRQALQQVLPPLAREVVERQFEGVKRHHREVRLLRDQARAALN